MDINLFRAIATLLALAAFLGIVWWAFAPSRRPRFERDAQLVFDDGDEPAPVAPGGARR